AVFENKTALPRFFSVPPSGIEVIPERSAQLSRLKDPKFDPEKSVIFSAEPAGPSVASSSPGNTGTRVEVIDKRMNGYRLRVESSGPAVVVASQMYYPGWKATVDGSMTAVYPVDVALTGIIIPAGMHDVRLFFQPSSFRIGAFISLASVALACVLLALKTRRFQPRRTGE